MNMKINPVAYCPAAAVWFQFTAQEAEQRGIYQ